MLEKSNILSHLVHPSEQIHTGPNGGRYVIRDNKKLYLISKPIKPARERYNPRNGAFDRFWKHQITL